MSKKNKRIEEFRIFHFKITQMILERVKVREDLWRRICVSKFGMIFSADLGDSSNYSVSKAENRSRERFQVNNV